MGRQLRGETAAWRDSCVGRQLRAETMRGETAAWGDNCVGRQLRGETTARGENI